MELQIQMGLPSRTPRPRRPPVADRLPTDEPTVLVTRHDARPTRDATPPVSAAEAA